jgi:hypothetical protein
MWNIAEPIFPFPIPAWQCGKTTVVRGNPTEPAVGLNHEPIMASPLM